MDSKEHHSESFLVMLVLLVVGISIGYALLSTTLIIHGNSQINKATWDIHFENINVTRGSVAINTANNDMAAYITNPEMTKVEYSVMLQEPGDYYEFTVDTVNAGTLDAEISDKPELFGIEGHEKYLKYSVTWDDTNNQTPAKNDVIKSGERRKVKVRIEYRTDLDSSNLPITDQNVDLSFSMNFIQAK